MKTYLITNRKDITANGAKLKAEDEIAFITSNVDLLTLLSMIQFRHAEVVEIEDLDEAPRALKPIGGDEAGADIEGDGTGENSPPLDENGGQSSNEEADQPGEGSEAGDPGFSDVDPGRGDGAEAGDLETDASAPFSDAELAEFVAAFVVDGLDEKIAESLVCQKVYKVESLKGLIAEGYDLTELDDIGPVRAEKILAVYGPKDSEQS